MPSTSPRASSSTGGAPETDYQDDAIYCTSPACGYYHGDWCATCEEVREEAREAQDAIDAADDDDTTTTTTEDTMTGKPLTPDENVAAHARDHARTMQEAAARGAFPAHTLPLGTSCRCAACTTYPTHDTTILTTLDHARASREGRGMTDEQLVALIANSLHLCDQCAHRLPVYRLHTQGADPTTWQLCRTCHPKPGSASIDLDEHYAEFIREPLAATYADHCHAMHTEDA